MKKASKNGWDFNAATADEIASFVENAAYLSDGQLTVDDVYAAIDIATGFGKEAKGVVYKVSGKNTESGLPYIGRSDNLPQRANATDRNRDGAEIIDLYPKGDRVSARVAEQKAIDGHGGVDSLDNKRNEISDSKRASYDLNYLVIYRTKR